jgi:hypothetical protein
MARRAAAPFIASKLNQWWLALAAKANFLQARAGSCSPGCYVAVMQ